MKRLVVLILSAFVLAACGEEGADKPYLKFAGGGFVFNYNVAEAYYGFVAQVVRRIPEGTILEAEFENPDGGAPLVVRQAAVAGRVDYVFRTPAVEGVQADRSYAVTLRLREPGTEKVLATYDTTFRSTADQAILPKQPTTIGPGYQLNPDSELLNPPPGDRT